jgi:DNA primase catalytic subunit
MASASSASSVSPVQLCALYRDYYVKLRAFPIALIREWIKLTNTHKRNTKCREFAIRTFPQSIFLSTPTTTTTTTDYFQRWVTFDQLVEHLQAQRPPLRIDIGPVYNIPMDIRENVTNFTAIESELRFDLDLSDLAHRHCVPSAHDSRTLCSLCSPILISWILCLHFLLVRVIGVLEHQILWVFSGGRGAHCWIKGAPWTTFGDTERMEYVKILRSPRIAGLMHHHPAIYRYIIDPIFSKHVHTQHVRFAPPEVYSMCGGSLEEISLKTCYPIIDENVTTHRNHLLKLPFSVHPSTLSICVPLDIHSLFFLSPSDRNIESLDYTRIASFSFSSCEHIPTLHTLASSNRLFTTCVQFFKHWIENFILEEKKLC